MREKRCLPPLQAGSSQTFSPKLTTSHSGDDHTHCVLHSAIVQLHSTTPFPTTALKSGPKFSRFEVLILMVIMLRFNEGHSRTL